MVIDFVILSLFVLSAVSSPIDEEGQLSSVEYVEPEYLDKLLAEKRYDEFNRLVGIDVPNLSRPRHENSTSDPMFNEGLILGDILLTIRQKEEARQGVRFDKYAGSKWPKSIPYDISNNFSAADRNTILNCISKWNSDMQNCLSFIPRTNEKAYIFYAPLSGCYSNLGRTGSQQVISLAPNGCMRQGTILHEMNHACGFTHEQNRPDRDEYVQVLNENIPDDWKSQYYKESPDVFGINGPYDFYSCMHYPMNAPGTGKPAFKILKSGIDTSKIGQRLNCTSIDIAKIKNLYGCQ